jgi:cyanate lyase
MAETIRQAARRQVKEATAARQRSWAEREERLSKAAVDVVAFIAARDRAEKAAATSIGAMLVLDVTLTEVGERCGLPLKEVSRLKRCFLDSADAGPADAVSLDDPRASGPSIPVSGGQRS